MLANSPQARSRSSRRGLTLIELVVVLTILVALGGLLVPVIGNALSSSSSATSTANLREVSNVLMRMSATQNDVGDNWRSGVYSTLAPAAGTSVNGNGSMTVDTLTGAEEAALAAIGISAIADHGDPGVAGYDATFNPGIDPNFLEVITLTADDQASAGVAALSAGKYIWLGIGSDWTGIGTQLVEAPVHVSDSAADDPSTQFSRYGAIFALEPVGATTRARFVKAAYCIDGTNWLTTESASQNFQAANG